MADPARCWNIADLRDAARRRLPLGVWEYLERGVEDETGMARGRAALDAITLMPRVARKVEQIDCATTLLGGPSALPFAIGPTGAAGLIWHEGDLHLARAAKAAGIPFCISSASTMDLEKIAAIGGRQWFQLYMWEDPALSLAVVDRAHAAGCEALVVTLDLPVPPNREYLFRNGFGMPFALNTRNFADLLAHPRWLAGVIGRYLLQGGLPGQANLPPDKRSTIARGAKPGALFKQDNLAWDDLARLRERWPGTFVLKGLLNPEDAARAAALGADAVIVSSHGGRALDHAPAAITTLPGIVAAAGGRMDVLFDSGVRRGSDVVKALALGASGVLLGRATLYGLAAAGEPGVARAIELLGAEVARTMAYCGVTSPAGITHEVLG